MNSVGAGRCAYASLVMNPLLDRDELGRGLHDYETTNQSSALLKKYRGQLGKASVLVRYQIRRCVMGRNSASSRLKALLRVRLQESQDGSLLTFDHRRKQPLGSVFVNQPFWCIFRVNSQGINFSHFRITKQVAFNRFPHSVSINTVW